MSNENLDTRLESLRSKADNSRIAFAAYTGGLAINSVIYGINLAVYASGEQGSLWNLASLAGIVLCGTGAAAKGIQSIQIGQEVAALSAVQAQLQSQQIEQ